MGDGNSFPLVCVCVQVMYLLDILVFIQSCGFYNKTCITVCLVRMKKYLQESV